MILEEDDQTVPADAVVWRRVLRSQCTEDENNPGVLRASSGAFEDSSDGSGTSVHLRAADELPSAYLEMVGRPKDGIAEIRVGNLRDKGYGVKHSPDPADARHYEIIHGVNAKKKTKKKDLQKMSKLIWDPVE